MVEFEYEIKPKRLPEYMIVLGYNFIETNKNRHVVINIANIYDETEGSFEEFVDKFIEISLSELICNLTLTKGRGYIMETKLGEKSIPVMALCERSEYSVFNMLCGKCVCQITIKKILKYLKE